MIRDSIITCVALAEKTNFNFVFGRVDEYLESPNSGSELVAPRSRQHQPSYQLSGIA